MRFKKFHGTMVFIISMLVSFAIFGSLMLAFISYTKSNAAEIKQENIPYISNYRPNSNENLNLLILGCENPESEPALSMVLSYNAPEGILTAILMPSATLATRKSGRIDSIKGHYDYEGLSGATDAVSSLFEIDATKYLRFQKTGIANMTDFFGGLPFNITNSITTPLETITKGEQLLDGRRLSTLIFNEVMPKTQNVTLQATLIEKLLKNNFTPTLVDKYDSFISSIFYNGETNLNQNDFLKRQTGFLNLLKLDSLVIKAYELKGNYKNNYTLFTPNSESLKQIKQALC